MHSGPIVWTVSILLTPVWTRTRAWRC